MLVSRARFERAGVSVRANLSCLLSHNVRIFFQRGGNTALKFLERRHFALERHRRFSHVRCIYRQKSSCIARRGNAKRQKLFINRGGLHGLHVLGIIFHKHLNSLVACLSYEFTYKKDPANARSSFSGMVPEARVELARFPNGF